MKALIDVNPTTDAINQQRKDFAELNADVKRDLFRDGAKLAPGAKNKHTQDQSYSVMNADGKCYLFMTGNLYCRDGREDVNHGQLIRGKLVYDQAGNEYFAKIVTVNTVQEADAIRLNLQHEMAMAHKYGQADSAQVQERIHADGSVTFYLIQKYAGQDAHLFLQDNSLSALEVMDISLQFLKTTLNIHESGDVHRDIKLPNFAIKRLENRQLVVSIIDLNTVKALNYDGYFDNQENVTTVDYLPPVYVDMAKHPENYTKELEVQGKSATILFRFSLLTDLYACALAMQEALSTISVTQRTAMSIPVKTLCENMECFLNETLDCIEYSFKDTAVPVFDKQALAKLITNLGQMQQAMNALLSGTEYEAVQAVVNYEPVSANDVVDKKEAVLAEMLMYDWQRQCFSLAATVYSQEAVKLRILKGRQLLTRRDEILLQKIFADVLIKNADYLLLFEEFSKKFPDKIQLLSVDFLKKENLSYLKNIASNDFERVGNRYHLLLLQQKLTPLSERLPEQVAEIIIAINDDLLTANESKALIYIRKIAEILADTNDLALQQEFSQWHSNTYPLLRSLPTPGVLLKTANAIASYHEYSEIKAYQAALGLYKRFVQQPLPSLDDKWQAITQALLIEALINNYSAMGTNLYFSIPVGIDWFLMPQQLFALVASSSQAAISGSNSIVIAQNIFNKEMLEFFYENFFKDPGYFEKFIACLKNACEEKGFEYSQFIASFFNQNVNEIDLNTLTRFEEVVKIAVVVKMLSQLMSRIADTNSACPKQALAMNFFWNQFITFVNTIIRHAVDNSVNTFAQLILHDSIESLKFSIASKKDGPDYSRQEQAACDLLSSMLSAAYPHKKPIEINVLLISQVFPAILEVKLEEINGFDTTQYQELFVSDLTKRYASELYKALVATEGLKESRDQKNLIFSRIEKIFSLIHGLSDPTLKKKLYAEPNFIRLVLQYHIRKEADQYSASTIKPKKLHKLQFVVHLLKHLEKKNVADASDPVNPIMVVYHLIKKPLQVDITNPAEYKEKINQWLREWILHNNSTVHLGNGSKTAQMLVCLPESLLAKAFVDTDIVIDDVWSQAYPGQRYSEEQRDEIRYLLLQKYSGDGNGFVCPRHSKQYCSFLPGFFKPNGLSHNIQLLEINCRLQKIKDLISSLSTLYGQKVNVKNYQAGIFGECEKIENATGNKGAYMLEIYKQLLAKETDCSAIVRIHLLKPFKQWFEENAIQCPAYQYQKVGNNWIIERQGFFNEAAAPVVPRPR